MLQKVVVKNQAMAICAPEREEPFVASQILAVLLQDGHACVNHLLSKGYATKGNVGIQGISAGAVMASNLVLLQPEVFGGVCLRMPFLGLFEAMTDPSHVLTKHEWAEWGNPSQASGLEVLRSICPYQVRLFFLKTARSAQSMHKY